MGENGHRYDLTLRPWFWLAGRRRNQRIFHNHTVVQIINDLLADYAQLGDPALDVQLSDDYPVLEYTVQYRESDLDFARRQKERHGISFHFRHAMGSHTLVLTDDVVAHPTIGSRPFKSYDGHHQAEGEHFWDWAPERSVTTGAIRLKDFNFKTPDAAMEAERLGDSAHAHGQIESFDYPGDYLAQDVGRIVAGLRTAQERGADQRSRAVGDCLSLGAGLRVTLSGDPVPGIRETYLCLSAAHHFVSEAYGTGGQCSDGYAFSASYVLMRDTAPMAPPRRAAIPVVHGPQTAIVVGEGEIDCEEYGRTLVRFHWDMDGAHSMRCRVSQNWAGNGWGGMVIPRIGMEVVVEFLEGDPDKPLVTGCVYNGRNAVPYSLPENKTISTFKSDTHQGQGFNEIRFEDERDREEIRIIAQKDHNVLVRNNEAKIVYSDSAEALMDNKLLEVFGNNLMSIAGSMTIHTGQSGPQGLSTQRVGVQGNTLSRMAYSLDRADLKDNGAPGDFTIISNGSHDVTVEQTYHMFAGQNHDTVVGKNLTTRIQGNRSARVDGDSSEHVGKSRTEFVGDKFTVVVGNAKLEMSKNGQITLSGSRIDLVADEEIKLTAPAINLND